ncbi:MAG: response regulator [Wolinella sp.]
MCDPSLIAQKKFEASILYVEDEENIRNVLTKILLRKFSEVLSASSGAEGVKLYLEKHPDIVITDIHMPDMSGIEMSKHIRAINPDALIVITTAFTDVEHFLDAINAGINRFIIKPIDSQKLEATIHELLTTVRRRHEFNDAR